MRKSFFRDADGEARVFWHHQNLAGDWYPHRGDTGPFWRHGRAWLHILRHVLGAEWSLGKRQGPALRFSIDDDGPSVHASISLIAASLYLKVESPWLQRFAQERTSRFDGKTYRLVEPREISVAVHDQALWWRMWTDPMSWSSTTPRWRDGAWHPIDTLLGRRKYSTETIMTEQVSIPLPERTYAGTVTLERATWKRQRWPKAEVRLRADIQVEGGVPIPGKGENAWDCDDDAVYSLTTQASTIPEAIGTFIQLVLEKRRRHGGVNWHPPTPEAAR